MNTHYNLFTVKIMITGSIVSLSMLLTFLVERLAGILEESAFLNDKDHQTHLVVQQKSHF